MTDELLKQFGVRLFSSSFPHTNSRIEKKNNNKNEEPKRIQHPNSTTVGGAVMAQEMKSTRGTRDPPNRRMRCFQEF